MLYQITHRSTYTYSDPISVCQNQVMLAPRSTPWAKCRASRLQITPTPSTFTRRQDYFNNWVHEFSIEESLRKLTITASSQVDVELPPDATQSTPTSWQQIAAAVGSYQDSNWFEAADFLYDSPRIRRQPQFADYAAPDFTGDSPVVESVLNFTRRLHKDIQYVKNHTNVGTTPEEVLEGRKGVCQDLAQLQIACLRSIGLPARYVSGYLRTVPPAGQPRRIGADESHAWISVYCGPAGWVDIDPTNDMLCTTDHIPVAWGRDYSDVAPIRGVYLGGGTSTLEVSVDVAPVE